MSFALALTVLLLQSADPAGAQPSGATAPGGTQQQPTPPAAPSADAPQQQPVDKPAETPAETPAQKPVEPPAAEKPAAEKPAADPDSAAAAPEKATRAYVVIDRVSTTAGIIESEDDTVIVLRDTKGRVRSLTKNRVVAVKYLLDGPPGRRVRVVFNDGRVLVAQLVEDGFENVAVEIEGITTRFPREAVDLVLPYPTDQELYERFRDTLEPDQYAARYTLAVWLQRKRMYAEAKRELESLLEVTNHYEAKQLLIEVNAQLKLLEPREPRPPRETPEPKDSAARGKTQAGLLTAADVNLIRVYELDVNDPPRLQVPESLIKTMIETHSDSELIPVSNSERNAMYSKEPIEIVRILFALKARDLYGEIKVLGEPQSLTLFRQRVHNAWLITNCATSRCHGGDDAGRFVLFNKDWKDPLVRTTNMLILSRTTLDDLPLIDFEKPIDSLLYQYALPKSEARRPHPDVRGWEPVFTKGRTELREDFIDWVRSMRIQRGEYPSIDFEPPGLKRRTPPPTGGPDR